MKFSKDYFIKVFKLETVIILGISFLINFSFVGIFANPVFKGVEITLENAGFYMSKFLPNISYTLWALGLMASGISSTTAGALTGQYLMDGIFDFKFSFTKRILITRGIVVIPCFIIMNAVNVNTIMNLLNII